LLTIPLARADSIQISGPITQFSLGGIQSTLYTPWLYSSMWGSTSDFVSDLFMGPFDVGQFAATVPSEGWLQGTTMNYTFNPVTDIVSGTFVGTEYVWNQPRTTGLREWTYNVSGTFSEHINFGGQPLGVGYGTRPDQYHQRELCRDERGARAGDVAHAGDWRGDAGVWVGGALASEELSMRMFEHSRCPKCGLTWRVYAPHANDPHDPIPLVR